MPHFPFEGSEMRIEHVKLGGEILNPGSVVIEAYEEGSFVI
jgi:hypothetical protein